MGYPAAHIRVSPRRVRRYVLHLLVRGLFFTGFNFQVFQFKKDVEFLDAGSIKLIFYASLVSLFCAVIWLYASTYRWLTRLMRHIKATKRCGDEDVWDFTFNSGRPEVGFVHVRDFDRKITYAG